MAFNANLGSTSFSEKQIIDASHPAVILAHSTKADQGELGMGLIVAKDANGDIVPYVPGASDTTNTPIGVLVSDVDTTKETTSPILRHGCVVKSALLTGSAASSVDDIAKLENIGIFAV
jgi:hypothetical protein